MTSLTMDDQLANSGANQSGLRDQNARTVLSYIRRHGAISSAEIARRSGLSAQTVSNIIRALEADNLLLRGDAVKGRVGKPSVPMRLNPAGSYAVGLNIGRRVLELVIVDFLGQQIDTKTISYAYPSTEDVFGFLRSKLPNLLKRHAIDATRIAGIGVSRPNRIWDWLEFVNAPEGAMQKWQDIDLEKEVSGITGLDVVVENDATSACIAEQLLGRGQEYRDFAYIFVGNFVGGGLVLDGKVISGRTRNAGAFGPLPVPDGKGKTIQLLDVASLHVLERDLKTAGLDYACLRDSSEDWSEFAEVLEDWINTTSQNLAVACAAVASIVEVEAILIDGAFPATVRESLTESTRNAYGHLDITGIEKPAIEQAQVGRRARSLGAALLPIHARYFMT